MNIYVGNLAPNVSEEDLKQLFESFGRIESVSIVKDKYSGQSRGFGFVEMETEEAAKNAIEKLAELINILAKGSEKISNKRMEEIRIHYPGLWVEIDRFRTEMMFGNITKVIDQGKKEGLFIDYPTNIVMNILVASVRNIVNPDFILNNNFSIIEAARYAFRIIIGGIVTDKGKKIFNQTINKM